MQQLSCILDLFSSSFPGELMGLEAGNWPSISQDIWRDHTQGFLLLGVWGGLKRTEPAFPGALVQTLTFHNAQEADPRDLLPTRLSPGGKDPS